MKRKEPDTGPAEKVVALAAAYISGDMTTPEIGRQATKDPELSSLLDTCLGCFSLPHELLASVDLDPFDSGMERYDHAWAITRQGLQRNLTLVREGQLSSSDLCDWVTDWMSWQVSARPDDQVVLELAGELMSGEEEIERIARSNFLFELYDYHLDNTPSEMAHLTTLGLALAESLEDLSTRFRLYFLDDMDEEQLRQHLSTTLKDHLEHLPTLPDDLLEGAQVLRSNPDPNQAIHDWLACICRTGDPVGCADNAEGF